MPHSLKQIEKNFAELKADSPNNDLTSMQKPISIKEKPLPKRIPVPNASTTEALEMRQNFFRERGFKIDALTGKTDPVLPENMVGNIESQLGYASLPIGVFGPMRINGTYAKGDFYVPMATSEGALLASYSRGAHVASVSGGISVSCVADSITRAPAFLFKNMIETMEFMNWLIPQFDKFHDIVSQTTRFGKLLDIQATINCATVFLIFEFSTGDAAGQNMVTISTNAICQWITENMPTKPKHWFLDGNMSSDKKATILSFQKNRGKKVNAEVTVPRRVIERFLHTTPEKMLAFYQTSVKGALQSGGIGVQAHFANALAAVYIACGQDAACVGESAIGMSAMEINDDGSTHMTISLPSLPVGTVGGGTHLPTAKECLGLLGCVGAGTARKFAEIVAATVLAGEISISGAFSAGHFAMAHSKHRHKN